MASHTEADLMREGVWNRHRRCFDVGHYHINVYSDLTESEGRISFRVIVWRGPRPAFETTVRRPAPKHTPGTRIFLGVAFQAMDEGARKMLVDQPALDVEAIYTTDQPVPAHFYKNVPC